jgi:hypothetical protein
VGYEQEASIQLQLGGIVDELYPTILFLSFLREVREVK